jgi:putative transposase
MKRFLTGCADTFNRRNRKDGELFENRYKLVVSQDDPCLLELFKYIHLNLLQSSLVKDVHQLDQTGLAASASFLDREKRLAGLGILICFVQRKTTSKKRYLDQVLQGIEMRKRPGLVGRGLTRSPSSWSEVKRLRKQGIA